MAPPFIVIGENIHCTRVLSAKSRRVVARPDGGAAIAYVSAAGEPRELPLTPALMAGQDYREGRVKHVQLAVQAQVALAQLERDLQRLNRALAPSASPAWTRSGRRVIRWPRVRRATGGYPAL